MILPFGGGEGGEDGAGEGNHREEWRGKKGKGNLDRKSFCRCRGASAKIFFASLASIFQCGTMGDSLWAFI